MGGRRIWGGDHCLVIKPAQLAGGFSKNAAQFYGSKKPHVRVKRTRQPAAEPAQTFSNGPTSYRRFAGIVINGWPPERRQAHRPRHRTRTHSRRTTSPSADWLRLRLFAARSVCPKYGRHSRSCKKIRVRRRHMWTFSRGCFALLSYKLLPRYNLTVARIVEEPVNRRRRATSDRMHYDEAWARRTTAAYRH